MENYNILYFNRPPTIVYVICLRFNLSVSLLATVAHTQLVLSIGSLFIVPYYQILSLSFVYVSHWMFSQGLCSNCFPSLTSFKPFSPVYLPLVSVYSVPVCTVFEARLTSVYSSALSILSLVFVYLLQSVVSV